MPNDLPPFMDKQKGIFFHNWLYSVVPVGELRDDWIINSNTGISERIINYPLVAYLTGYCRNCGRAFSKKIDTSINGEYTETIMNVQKEGCIDPNG